MVLVVETKTAVYKAKIRVRVEHPQFGPMSTQRTVYLEACSAQQAAAIGNTPALDVEMEKAYIGCGTNLDVVEKQVTVKELPNTEIFYVGDGKYCYSVELFCGEPSKGSANMLARLLVVDSCSFMAIVSATRFLWDKRAAAGKPAPSQMFIRCRELNPSDRVIRLEEQNHGK